DHPRRPHRLPRRHAREVDAGPRARALDIAAVPLHQRRADRELTPGAIAYEPTLQVVEIEAHRRLGAQVDQKRRTRAVGPVHERAQHDPAWIAATILEGFDRVGGIIHRRRWRRWWRRRRRHLDLEEPGRS